MTKYKVYLPIVLALAVVLGIYMGKNLNYSSRPVAMMDGDLREQKLRQLINFIEYDYVDEVNTDSLLDVTISELLHKLDPHSSYIAPQDVEQTEENLRGSFEGIGIEYMIKEDTLTVLRTIENGPSQKAGLMGGDRIISIDGEGVAGVEFLQENYPKILKGKSGSKVKLGIYRPMEDERFEVTVKRGSIPIKSLTVAYMLNDTVGLIKLQRFSERSADEFENALKNLQRQGMKSLVFDLRDNPGGLLKSAIEISDQFLSKNKLIVFTKERSGQVNETYASRRGSFEKGRLVILINESSASASEIVAGALQDNDRAIVVGRRSFGKGLVQEEMQLKDGSRVRLTTARYYTPTGRSIQKPYDRGYEDYLDETNTRYQNGELMDADSIEVNQDKKFVTPGGKTVYGGGGIVPDVFVPIDTSGKALGWLFHYFGYGSIDRFAFQYVDRNRKALLEYEPADFIANFNVTDTLVSDLLAFMGVEIKRKELNEGTLRILRTRTKAMIARNLWGDVGMYPILYETDPTVIRALELMNERPEMVLVE